MTVRSGITAKTPESIFIDAGAVYLNYGLADQRLLGATRGGNEFNLNRVIKNIEADGLKGAVKGMKRVTEVNPQITANLIELNVKNLVAAIAGANQTDQVNINVEHVGIGDVGGTKEFSLLHGFTTDASKYIVENSEKIYVQKTHATTGPMLLQTRSKKYASRFVGTKATDNKEFNDTIGNWAVSGTGAIAIDTDGQSGNCMKFTAAADSSEEFLKLLGADGLVLTNLVDGEHYRFQIALKKGVWAAASGKVTVTCNNLSEEITLADPAAWVMHVFEFTASGTSANIVLSATGPTPTTNDILYIDSLELEKVDTPAGNGQIGYVMNWVEGKVYFVTAPTEGFDIVASYTYVPSTASDAKDTTITGGEIEDTDYIANVAIVGNVSGKTYPIICIVNNALADAGFSISTAPRDEAVPVIIFTGHYDPDDLDTEPWEIRYPKT